MIEYTAATTSGSIPASVQRDMMDRRGTLNIVNMAVENIRRLDAEGKSTSGWEGVIVDIVPRAFKGVAEQALFGLDEQEQRAQNALIDNLLKEAVTTGVVSDQDSNQLSALYIGSGGLSPDQQLARLYAAQKILEKYGVDLMSIANQGGTTLGLSPNGGGGGNKYAGFSSTVVEG
jgi:hypothetical protein